MNSIILCEGFDDLWFLGYFIHKTSNAPKWDYGDGKGIVSENFQLPKIDKRRQKIEVYQRGGDRLAIWAVGGKDSFEFPISTIRKFNISFPDERFENIVIVADRDTDDISKCIKNLETMFELVGWDLFLENNKKIPLTYKDDFNEGNYSTNIVPIIIPFDANGALETILINSIASSGKSEDAFVVEAAKKYICDIISSGNLSTYLQHERLKIKAEFSAIISITNPDKSTGLFNDLLMLYDWETRDEVKKHFEIIENIFK